ncbi:MAG: sigma-70 family RNA polymerase sigma factor [Planctomycetaceae bacterium]|nr:sigma-70 family RNA polymerase sigma factor [Planctomycetaceae bacterium]
MSRSGETSAELAKLLSAPESEQVSATAELIEVASRRMLKLARRMLRDYSRIKRWEETDDVYQSAVIRLHRALQAERPTSVAGFWSLAATQIRRTLIDLARHYYGPLGQGTHQRDLPTSSCSQQVEPAFEAPVSGEPTTLECWARFHESIARLPTEERDVFELLWYGGMSNSEVADALGISSRTARRRVLSARLRLQQQLEESLP